MTDQPGARRAGLGAIVERAVAWAEGRPLPVADWFAGGVPLALLVPLGVALPFALSGPLRAILGWSLVASLGPAMVASALVVAPVIVWARHRARRPFGLPHLVPLLVALFGIFVLYRRAFAGLTNYAGGDGGVHVAQQQLFAYHLPGTYEGFVSMYSLIYWIQQIARCNAFWGFCATYYFGVAVVAALPAIIGFIAIDHHRERRAAWYVGALTCFAVSLFIQFYVILPQQHYHQTDGFFPHLFGLIPLLMIWLVDAIACSRLWRWLGLLGGVVLYRYTYGLNLGDVMVAVGVLLFVDAFERGVPRLARWSFIVAPFVMLVATRPIYERLRVLLSSFGWIIPYDAHTVLTAETLACAGLLVAGAVARYPAAAKRLRLFRFPVVFGVVNTVVAVHIMRLPPRQPYYFLKYPIHAVVLLAAATTVAATIIATAVTDGIARRAWDRTLVWAAAAMTLLCLAVGHWRSGYAPLQQTFRERILGSPPFTYNRPLADLGAWSRIRATLDQQHKRFGGYITSYWPMFNFMNAGLGYANGGRTFWERGGVRFEPGYCVFWERGKVDWWTTPGDLTQPLRREQQILDARGDAQCVSYRAAWNQAVERTLCHACW